MTALIRILGQLGAGISFYLRIALPYSVYKYWVLWSFVCESHLPWGSRSYSNLLKKTAFALFPEQAMSLSCHFRQQGPVWSSFQFWLFGCAAPTWPVGSSSLPKAGAAHCMLCTCAFGASLGIVLSQMRIWGIFLFIVSSVIILLAPGSMVYCSSTSYKNGLFASAFTDK